MIGLVIFAFIFTVISFIVVINAFINMFTLINEDKDRRNKILKSKLHLEHLKGPKIMVVEPKNLILQKSVQIDQGVFDNPDHKNYILNDISISLGKELLEQKLINFDVQSIQSPNHIGKEYRIIAQIKLLLDDKRN